MLVEQLEFWHWLILAAVLIGIEMLAPGAVFLWLGVSAGLVGLLVLAIPATPWEIQLLVFAALSVATAFGWRAYRKRYPAPESDQPNLNQRGAQYIGRTFTLKEAIADGQGKLNVDDTVWKVVGSDQPEGSKVKVTGVNGTVLTVEPA